MATLAARVTALAEAVRDKINTMTPRLLPTGGEAGLALVKASGADFATAWAKVNQAFGFAAFCAGKPDSGEVIAGGIAPYAFTLTPANCAARSLAAAGASAVLTLKCNGAAIGTVTFNAGQTTGTIAISAAAIATGDLVTITAPSPADSALADIAILLKE